MLRDQTGERAAAGLLALGRPCRFFWSAWRRRTMQINRVATRPFEQAGVDRRFAGFELMTSPSESFAPAFFAPSQFPSWEYPLNGKRSRFAAVVHVADANAQDSR